MEHFLIIVLLGFPFYSALNIIFLSVMTLKPAFCPNSCPLCLFHYVYTLTFLPTHPAPTRPKTMFAEILHSGFFPH